MNFPTILHGGKSRGKCVRFYSSKNSHKNGLERQRAEFSLGSVHYFDNFELPHIFILMTLPRQYTLTQHNMTSQF